jgi:hypothetical protein
MSERHFRLTVEQVEQLRRGTHDYGGGRHEPREVEAFHHGIDTAFNVLASMVREHETSQHDTQNEAVRRIGSRAPQEIEER